MGESEKSKADKAADRAAAKRRKQEEDDAASNSSSSSSDKARKTMNSLSSAPGPNLSLTNTPAGVGAGSNSAEPITSQPNALHGAGEGPSFDWKAAQLAQQAA